MIKVSTYGVQPTAGRVYEPGQQIGEPFILGLSAVAKANGLADVLTDLTFILRDEARAVPLFLYLLSDLLPGATAGQVFVPRAEMYLGRLESDGEWYCAGPLLIDEQHRLRLPIYGQDKAYCYVVAAGQLCLDNLLTVKVGVHWS